MNAVLTLLIESIRQAPGRANDIAFSLGVALSRVLAVDLCSPQLLPAPHSALAAVFHRLRALCSGVDEGDSEGSGGGAGGSTSPVSSKVPNGFGFPGTSPSGERIVTR
jgi:hypothetical protein